MRTVLEYPIELEHLMNLAALGLALNTPSYHRLVQDCCATQAASILKDG